MLPFFYSQRTMTGDIDMRFASVLASVLGPEATQLSSDDGPGAIATWDSVNHLNLVLAVEAEFGIQFATSDIPHLLSIGKIRERLKEP